MSSTTPLAHDRAVALIRTALDSNWSGYGTLDKSRRFLQFAAAVAHAHNIHASQFHVLRGAFVTAYKPVKRKRGDSPPESGPLVLRINQRAVSYQDITAYLQKNRDLVKAKPPAAMENAHGDAQPVAKAQVPTSTSASSPSQEEPATTPHAGQTCAALEARVIQLEAVIGKIPLLEEKLRRLEARLDEAPSAETNDNTPVAAPPEVPRAVVPKESTPSATGSPGDETPTSQPVSGLAPSALKRPREEQDEASCFKKRILQSVCEEIGVEHDGLSLADLIAAIEKWDKENPLCDLEVDFS